jgi:hypothetical protein
MLPYKTSERVPFVLRRLANSLIFELYGIILFFISTLVSPGDYPPLHPSREGTIKFAPRVSSISLEKWSLYPLEMRKSLNNYPKFCSESNLLLNKTCKQLPYKVYFRNLIIVCQERELK